MRTAVALAVMCLVAGCPALGGLSAEPATATGNRTLAISWLTAGFDPMRTDYNNLETTIGPANAYYIHELWSTDLGGAMVAQPVEAAGVNMRGARTSLIYEGTEQGEFYAIRASNVGSSGRRISGQ